MLSVLTLSFVQAPLLTAKALLAAETIQAGGTLGIALELTPAEHWHWYWRNPGDSGVAPSVEWKLPAGWKARPTSWPVPKLFVGESGNVNYGFEEPAALIERIEVPANTPAGRYTLSGSVSWMVCKDYCTTGDSKIEVSVTVGEPAGAVSEQFKAHAARIPNTVFQGVAKRQGDDYVLMPSFDMQDAKAYFFCQGFGVLKHQATQELQVQGRDARLVLPASPYENAKAARLKGVLTVEKQGAVVNYWVDVPVDSQ